MKNEIWKTVYKTGIFNTFWRTEKRLVRKHYTAAFIILTATCGLKKIGHGYCAATPIQLALLLFLPSMQSGPWSCMALIQTKFKFKPIIISKNRTFCFMLFDFWICLSVWLKGMNSLYFFMISLWVNSGFFVLLKCPPYFNSPYSFHEVLCATAGNFNHLFHGSLVYGYALLT